VLQQLLPISLGGVFEADLALEGAALDAAEAAAAQLLLQLVPDQAGAEKIAGWERNLGITPAAGASLENRMAQVLAHLRARGGLSISYFTQLAAALGYEVEIEDMRPFEPGDSAGYPIWDPGVIWCWRVNVLNHGLTFDDFLGKNPAAVNALGIGWLWRWDAIGGPLEKLFHLLRPAGGMPLFYYPLDIEAEEDIEDSAASEDFLEDSAASANLILDVQHV
jgi:uncharacterized protein YmfQ (DUF2313 family)